VPFTAATPGAVLIKQMQEMPVPLRKLRRELPPAVERAVMQALEKEPQKRQNNMGEVVEQLRKAEEQLRGKAGTRAKEPGLGWDRIGQAFRRQDEKRAERFEPPPEPLPIEPSNARTILETAGPQWAPTQAISFDDFDQPKPRVSTYRRSMIMLGLLALAGVLGTVYYLKSGPFFISESLTPTVTSISPPSPELVSLFVTSDRRNLAPKERMTLTATGKFSDGSEQPISSGLKWHSSNSSVITINSEGQAEAQNEGIAELSAELKEQVSPPVTLVVKTEKPTTPTPAPAPMPSLRSLVVISVKRELQANERMVLRAKGQYSDGKESDINDGVLWQSSDERIASIDSRGRVTAHRSGQVKLNASYEGVASPAISLIVKDPTSFEPELPAEPRQKLQTEKPRPDIRENLRTATIFWEQGKYSEAMIELEHALSLAPESKEARSLRIRVMKAWEAEKELNSKKP
jgi:hypothetical protein